MIYLPSIGNHLNLDLSERDTRLLVDRLHHSANSSPLWDCLRGTYRGLFLLTDWSWEISFGTFSVNCCGLWPFGFTPTSSSRNSFGFCFCLLAVHRFSHSRSPLVGFVLMVGKSCTQSHYPTKVILYVMMHCILESVGTSFVKWKSCTCRTIGIYKLFTRQVECIYWPDVWWHLSMKIEFV